MKYGTMSYLVSNNNVLMIKKVIRENDPNSGYFTLPGGKLEPEEKGLNNPRGRLESAVRETKEEIGIELIKPVLKGIILFDNEGRIFDNWKNPDNFFVYVYSATKYLGELVESDEGAPIRISLNMLDTVPSNPGDKKMYEWLRDGRNFFGVIKHKGKEIDEQGTMVDFF